MPKVFKYEIGDRVEVTDIQGAFIDLYNGLRGTVKELLDVSQYDYRVEIDGGGQTKFKESELSKLYEYEYTPEIGDLVKLKTTEEEGIVETIDHQYKQVEVRCGVTYKVVGWNKVEFIEEGIKQMETIEVETERESVAEHLLNTFMSQYKNQDNTYTVPKEVLLNLISNVYEQE